MDLEHSGKKYIKLNGSTVDREDQNMVFFILRNTPMASCFVFLNLILDFIFRK